MGFQVLFSSLIVLAVIRLLFQYFKKHINTFFLLVFLTIWCSAFFLTWNIGLLNRMGSFLGIQRGATVLVYMAIFLLFYYVFVSLIKFYMLESSINKIIKKNAVEDFLRRYNIKSGE